MAKLKIMSHIYKAIAIPRNEILNRNPKEYDDKIPLIVAFNRTFPDLGHIIIKSIHILQIETKLKEIFKNPSVITFKRNKNLRDFIVDNKLCSNKKLIHAKTFDKGKCHPCLTRTINLRCK